MQIKSWEVIKHLLFILGAPAIILGYTWVFELSNILSLEVSTPHTLRLVILYGNFLLVLWFGYGFYGALNRLPRQTLGASKNVLMTLYGLLFLVLLFCFLLPFTIGVFFWFPPKLLVLARAQHITSVFIFIYLLTLAKAVKRKRQFS